MTEPLRAVVQETAQDAWWAMFRGNERQAAVVVTGLVVLGMLGYYAVALKPAPPRLADPVGFMRVVSGTVEMQSALGDRRWTATRAIDRDNVVVQSTADSSHTRLDFGSGSSLRLAERSAFVVQAHDDHSLTAVPLQGRLWIRLAAGDAARIAVHGGTVTCSGKCNIEVREGWIVIAHQGTCKIGDTTLDQGHAWHMGSGLVEREPDDPWVEWNLQS